MDKQAALAEAYRRGILPPDKAAAYEEAVKRGLVSDTENFGNPGVIQKVKDLISGDKRTEFDYPEIGSSPEYGGFDRPLTALKSSFGMLTSSTPQQELDVLKSNYPDATFEKDKFGNDIVVFPSGKYYVNKPGLSWRDFSKAGFQGGLYALAAQAGGAPFQSLLGQTAGVAAGTGVMSAGLDAAASAAGSEQGIDVPRAATTAAFAGLFESARPALGPLWRAMTAKSTTPSVQEARVVLQQAGFDPQELTDDAVNYFIVQAKNAMDPASAAMSAGAQTLPVKVPLSKGQVTGSARQQMTEDLMEKGAFGDAAETIMKGQRAKTEEALRANIPAIQQRIGGGQIVQRGEGAAAAQQALVGKEARLAGMVDDAYTAARATSGKLPGEAGGGLYESVASSIDDFTPHASVAKTELDRLKGILTKKTKSPLLDARGNQMGGKTTFADTDIKNLYDWRRRVSTLANNASDKTDAAALKNMVKQFDASMQDALEQSLLAGDDEAIKAWTKAIRLRRAKGKLFESDDLVSALVEREYKGGGVRLKVAPEAAGNYIFGKSDLGILAKPEMARELRRLRQVLGANSQEWNAIREEAFLRFASVSEGAYSGGQRGFSGVKFHKAWNDALKKNPEVINTLFSGEEKKLISQFANVAARATNPVKGGANFSNTTPAMANMMQRLSGFLAFGERGRALLSRIFPAGYDALQAGQAYKATRGMVPKRQIPVGRLGAIGGTGAAVYPDSSSNQ